MKLSEDKVVVSMIQELNLTIISERYDPEIFGNTQLEMQDGRGLRIRITRDRNQYFLDLAVGSGEWTSLHDLETFLHP